MGCGVVERHLARAWPTQKRIHAFPYAFLCASMGSKVLQIMRVWQTATLLQQTLALSFDGWKSLEKTLN